MLPSPVSIFILLACVASFFRLSLAVRFESSEAVDSINRLQSQVNASLDDGYELFHAHKEVATDPFTALKTHAGTAMTLYYTVSSISTLVQGVKDWRAISKFSLTDSLNKDLDPLIEVHDMLVRKTHMEPSDWTETCNNCSEAELDDMYSFNKPLTLGKLVDSSVHWLASSVGTAEDPETCPIRLKKVVATMRRALEVASQSSDELLEELKSTQPEEKDKPYRHLPDRGCDGDCDGCAADVAAFSSGMEEELKGFHQAAQGTNPLCRELPQGFSREQVVSSCKEQCSSMDGCAGFTLYNGTIADYGSEVWNDKGVMHFGDLVRVHKNGQDRTFRQCRDWPLMLAWVPSKSCLKHSRLTVACGPTHLGCFGNASMRLVAKVESSTTQWNKCCFRPSVGNEYKQEATECFVRPPKDPLWKADPAGAAAWMEGIAGKKDDPLSVALVGAAKKVKAAGFNGLALQAMGRAKLEEHLDLSPNHAKQVLCMIDATKSGGDPESCYERSFLGLWARAGKFVDPSMLWGSKSTTAAKAPAEVMEPSALSKIVHRAKEYVTQYSYIGEAVINTVYTGMDIAYTFIETNDILFGFDGLDWLSLTAAATGLLARAAAVAWEQCSFVEAWARRTELSDTSLLNQLIDEEIKA